MAAILITGMSGTGKSTVMAILRRRGHAVAETDEAGWCVPQDGNWNSEDSTWIWDESRIEHLLDDHDSTHLFVDGCRENQARFYHRFSHVVVLAASLEVMLSRVQYRTNNSYGSTARQREQIVQDKLAFEPMLLRGADLVIDTTTAPAETIADQLEALL